MGRSNYIKKGLLSTPPLNPELQEIYKFKKKKGIILSNPLAQKKLKVYLPLIRRSKFINRYLTLIIRRNISKKQYIVIII